ncbi:daunorubicin/doxorubicin resistance ABC transporter ATP-binding protein DrrA, partial [Streptomyces cinereoruber]
MADLAIETEGLVKVFGTNRAVDGVDLRVPAGTVYGVLSTGTTEEPGTTEGTAWPTSPSRPRAWSRSSA